MTVVPFPAPIDRDGITRSLHQAGIREFVLIGYDREGLECVITDLSDGGDILWHLRRTEHKMMGAADGMVRDPHDFGA